MVTENVDIVKPSKRMFMFLKGVPRLVHTLYTPRYIKKNVVSECLLLRFASLRLEVIRGGDRKGGGYVGKKGGGILGRGVGEGSVICGRVVMFVGDLSI